MSGKPLIILLLFFPCFVLETTGAPSDTAIFQSPTLRSSISWHPEDLMVGIGAGIEIMSSYETGLEFFFRPHYEARVYQEGREKIQYREKRYAGFIYVERRFDFPNAEDYGMSLGLSTGPAWELRKGFPERSSLHWMLIPRIGMVRRFGKHFQLHLEYRFAPEPALNGKEHRAGLRAIYAL